MTPSLLPLLLAGLAERARKTPRLVVGLVLLLVVLAGLAVVRYLGVDTDTDHLFASRLPWRQQEMAFARAFPQTSDLLVVAIDSPIPEAAEATAAALAAALAADPGHFRSVRRPDADPYFDREGLLFLDRETLSGLLDRIVDAQPFLGQLAADPSLRGLFAALALMGTGVAAGEADLTAYEGALTSFHQALAAAAGGHPVPLSWERLIGGGEIAARAGPYRFLLVQPVLDHAALAPAAEPIRILRARAAGLEFVASGLVHVHLTGPVALDDEEFSTLTQGMLTDTAVSLALITCWLFFALGSLRLIAAVLASLLAGLVLTMGFAALAVGTLNLVSLAFAVLFVGIAVDFAIQFAVRYREARFLYASHAAALAATARGPGGQILTAAAAAAAGFYAFLPTDFRGVAELGLIAGTGMLIAFLITLSLLPALLTLLAPAGEPREVGFRALERLERLLLRFRLPLLVLLGAAAVAGLAALFHLPFDADPLHTKDPRGEAMRTLARLRDDPLTNPYSADILTPDLAAADRLAAALARLPETAEVLTLSSFVPEDQKPKLALIADTAAIMAPTLAPRESAPVHPADIRLAIATARAALAPALAKLPPSHPLALIAGDLEGLSRLSDTELMAANAALVRFLPDELARLRTALSAKPVSLAHLPPSILADWRAPDGRIRVSVFPKREAETSAGLASFVDRIEALAPNATGSAVVIVESSRTIIGAFRTALGAAFAAIALLLAIALRRPLAVLLVLGTLLSGAAYSALIAWVGGLALNFANIIALPLLLGVGVSFNVYFVMNWTAGERRFLGTATARAVLFSALTTATAFGSLALSPHPGTASLGKLLLLGLAATLFATFLLLPLLLARREEGA